MPVITPLMKIEEELRALLHGKFTSLTLSLNDDSTNYRSAQEAIENDEAREENVRWHSFRSPEERQECIDTNSIWVLHWYPDTPIGSYTLSAPTLLKLFDYLRAEFPATQKDNQ